MILFHAKRDGTVTTTPNFVPQGSSMQDLVVASEFDYAYCAIKLLPASGEYIEDVPCTPILQKDYSTIFTAALPPKATVVAGSVDYQLIFTAADGTTQTTLVGSFTVPRGVPVSTPSSVGELSVKTVADLYTILSSLYVAYVGHEQDIYQSVTDIAALKKTVSSAGYVTIPVTEWEDGSPTIATFTLDGFGAGMTAMLIPADSNTQTAAREARLSAYPVAFPIDSDTQTVEIIRANAEKAPEIPLRFAYMILKTDTTVAPSVAILGVDAYGEGGGTTSGVDETAVRAIITAMLGNVENVRQYSADNPPPYPVTSVNGKIGAVSLTIPSKASDVGADPAGTASSKLITHNVDTASHQDLRLELQRLADRLAAVLDSDDTTLDELSEIVAYIKSNKALIDAITTAKVSVADIIDNLTTNVVNKPLSAAQGVALKTLIDGLQSGKVDKAGVASEVTAQLTAAKQSGEFDGEDGKSAYAYAQDGGYAGTEEEFGEKLAVDTTPFVITVTGDADSGYTVDKTKDEINEAYRAKRPMVCNVDGGYSSIPLTRVGGSAELIRTYSFVSLNGRSYTSVNIAVQANGHINVTVTAGTYSEGTLKSLTINGTTYDGSRAVSMNTTPLVVEITMDSSTGEWVSTHSVDAILSAFFQGRLPICNVEGVLVPFVSYDSNQWVQFLLTIAAGEAFLTYVVNIERDGVIIEMVETTSLPNPQSLAIGGTTYDGSEAVDITDTINSMIDAKLGVIENGSY